uniref:Phosphoglycerate mutase family protein n=1 Tax=Globodera pallida TaxID=36090 RepID=A0A183C6R5_GLOPA
MCTPRHIYAVRHAERIDDTEKRKVWHYNSRFSKDNPPLSPRGRQQTEELYTEFLNIPIEYCFTSPYERCVQTAAKILEGRRTLINVEPGLIESLQMIYDRSSVRKVGFHTGKELAQRYDNINKDYEPMFLAPPESEIAKGKHGCTQRVEKTLRKIVDKCHGDILIVSHQGPLAALQKLLTASIEYGGTATVSKYAEVPGCIDRFEAEYLYDSSHLSDPVRLCGKDYNRKKKRKMPQILID